MNRFQHPFRSRRDLSETGRVEVSIVWMGDDQHARGRIGRKQSFQRVREERASGQSQILLRKSGADARTASCRDHQDRRGGLGRHG